MTFREKLKMEHPSDVSPCYGGGCYGCPHWKGYEKEEDRPCKDHIYSCTDCWDRVIPGTEHPSFANLDGAIESLKNLSKELKKLGESKKYDEPAKEYKALHDSLIRAGFTREEATAMVIAAISKPDKN